MILPRRRMSKPTRLEPQLPHLHTQMCRVLGLVIHAFWQALLVAQSDAEAGEVVVAADAALQCDALVDQVEGVSVHLGPTGLDDSLGVVDEQGSGLFSFQDSLLPLQKY